MDIAAQLVDFGALGLFAGFLIWLNAKSQTRLDDMFERFQQTIDNQEAAHQAAEELIRSRYDALLLQYNAEREKVYKDVVSALGEIRASLDRMERP